MNVVATSIRENLISAETGELIVADAPIYVRSYDHERPWEVLRLSVASRVATYDCEFVVLARRLMLRFVTKDKALLRNFPETSKLKSKYEGNLINN